MTGPASAGPEPLSLGPASTLPLVDDDELDDEEDEEEDDDPPEDELELVPPPVELDELVLPPWLPDDEVDEIAAPPSWDGSMLGSPVLEQATTTMAPSAMAPSGRR